MPLTQAWLSHTFERRRIDQIAHSMPSSRSDARAKLVRIIEEALALIEEDNFANEFMELETRSYSPS
jgi:uncharacterized protein (DUF2384 family)